MGLRWSCKSFPPRLANNFCAIIPFLPASCVVTSEQPLISTTGGRRSNREVPMKRLTRRTTLAAASGALAFAALPARAAKQYGPGVTDTELKIGNTSPYSGPLSNASPIPLTMEAYFKMINEQGGINGRKITWISYDDVYSPPN